VEETMQFRNLSAIVIAACLSVGLLTACEDEPSADEARDALCDDLSAFRDATQELSDIDANSTVGELEDARDDLAAAWDDVQASAEDVDDPKLEELEEAYASLEATIDGIDEETMISDAIADVQADLEAVDAAWQQVFAAQPCDGDAEPTAEAEGTPTESIEPTAAATEATGTETPAAETPAVSPTVAATTPTAAATTAATVQPTAAEPETTATPE
jgi:hypothetical protein